MDPEAHDPTHSAADETQLYGLESGLALVQEAEDAGNWRPLIGWLARNPAMVGEIDQFLNDQSQMRSIMNSPVVPDRTGSVIAGYELKELIGRGGMGDVYKAVDLKLKREVAIKFARAVSDKTRFRYEAEVIASFTHPNIVPILSFEEDRDGLCLVMPLMTGGSLAERLKRLGPDRCLPADEAAEIVRDIALGVHHAHQHGLIHRDLKPGNILLDRDGTPHVADFGLAHPVDVSISAVAGAPVYMAPEQARGDKYLTIAVDVHALGVILFELLTGGVPHGGNMVSIFKKLTDPNEPVPSVLKFRPKTPRDLADICQKCREFDPNHRYASALEVAEDLDRYLKQEPVKAQPQRLLSALGRAITRPPELVDMRTWQLLFWGAASTFFSMGVMQAGILLGAPLWVSHAAIAWYLIVWLGLMWGFLVIRRTELNPFERSSMKIHFGAKFGCIAILPVVFWLHDGNPVYALPAFLVIVGLAVYVHGITYWGRLYLNGLLFFAAAATMPLVPVNFWPAVYGLLLGVFQITSGIHLRQVKHEFETANRCEPQAGTA